MVIAPACQAGDRGFNPRRSRYATPTGRGFFYRAVAQWLARSVRDREAGSSSLPSPNKSLNVRFRMDKLLNVANQRPWQIALAGG